MLQLIILNEHSLRYKVKRIKNIIFFFLIKLTPTKHFNTFS